MQFTITAVGGLLGYWIFLLRQTNGKYVAGLALVLQPIFIFTATVKALCGLPPLAARAALHNF